MRPSRQQPLAQADQAGFTLVELLLAMLLLLLALALAAQLLGESAEQLLDSAGDQADPTVPQILDRLRGDVQGSSGYAVCEEDRLVLAGHPAGLVLYQRDDDTNTLRRGIFAADGTLQGESAPWRGVAGWHCTPLGPRLLRLDVLYQAWKPRRTLGPPLPAARGAKSEVRGDTLFLTLRGAGLGSSW